MIKYKKFKYLFMLLLFFTIGIGYAFLTTNLNITGTTILKDNRWDIHLENVQVKSGSVTASNPTINTARDTVTYSVTLEEPGDFFEFTVDAKNDGTIDGMISNVSSKLNGVEITTLPSAIDYGVTYYDGIEIESNHLLEKNSSITYSVYVEYRTDIEASDLPNTETSLNFSFTITYVQADNNAIIKPNAPPIFTISDEMIYLNSQITPELIYDDYNDAIASSGYPFFLKHNRNRKGEVTESYVGFVLNNNDYYLQLGGTTYNPQTEYYNYDSIYYESNKAELLSAFGSSNCRETESVEYGKNTECTIADLTAATGNDGYSIVYNRQTAAACHGYGDGHSQCLLDA